MPDTVNIPLLRASILFQPRRHSYWMNIGGAAGYRPRVRNVYSVQTFSVIAGEPAIPIIRKKV